MIFASCFTNFGPYHIARLRALASRLRERGDCLIAYEMAATERDACARVAPAPPASAGTSVARSPLLRNSSTASFGKRARESTSSAQRAATSRPILSLSASMSMGVFSPCLSTTR